LAYLQQSIHENPNAAEAYFFLGLDLKALGKDQLAVAALQKAKELENLRGTSFADLKNIRLRIL
jgi:cytochrome c-type biogenesis protein CcmH/NrfG